MCDGPCRSEDSDRPSERYDSPGIVQECDVGVEVRVQARVKHRQETARDLEAKQAWQPSQAVYLERRK